MNGILTNEPLNKIREIENELSQMSLYRNGDYVSITVDGVTYENLGRLSTDTFLNEVEKCINGEESLVSIKTGKE